VARIENRARLTDHGEQELRATVLDLTEVALAALSPSAGLRRSVALHGKDLIAGGRSYDLSALDRLVLLARPGHPGPGGPGHGLALAARYGRGRVRRRVHGQPGPGRGRAVRPGRAESGSRGRGRAGPRRRARDRGIVRRYGRLGRRDRDRGRTGGLLHRRAGQGTGNELAEGLVDHATTALLEACGDAVLTGATQINANDLIIIGVS
jgi:hypothetical protein